MYREPAFVEEEATQKQEKLPLYMRTAAVAALLMLLSTVFFCMGLITHETLVDTSDLHHQDPQVTVIAMSIAGELIHTSLVVGVASLLMVAARFYAAAIRELWSVIKG